MINVTFKITNKQFECSHIHGYGKQECELCGIPEAFFNVLWDLRNKGQKSGTMSFPEPVKKKKPNEREG